jgi:hypothetical protein
MRGLVPGNHHSLRLFSANHAIEEEVMNRRNQSGYAPVVDPRTGRPPLPEDRDRARRALPDEIESDLADSSSFAGAHCGELENGEGEAGDRSTLGRLASEGSEAFRAASDTVTSQVGAATSVAMERGSEFANTASRQMQTYSDGLAAFTRRRPIGALAGAVIFGILLGLMGRRRS